MSKYEPGRSGGVWYYYPEKQMYDFVYPETKRKSIYVIGSLRNPVVPKVAEALRSVGLDAFDDWYAAGPEADDYWRDYEKSRGHNFKQALSNHAAKNVFEFDKRHLNRVDMGILVMPAGKSGHLELGYLVGLGKPGFILLDGEPERFDVMCQFATEVFLSQEEMLDYFK